MLSCLLFAAAIAAIGFGLHRMRVKALRRHAADDLVARTKALAAEAKACAADRAQAEQRLEELVALDRSKSRILAGLVNDMRTPLMLVMAPLQNRNGLRSSLEAEGVPVTSMLEQAGQLRYQIEQLGGLHDVEQESLARRRAQLALGALEPLAPLFPAGSAEYIGAAMLLALLSGLILALMALLRLGCAPGDFYCAGFR